MAQVTRINFRLRYVRLFSNDCKVVGKNVDIFGSFARGANANFYHVKIIIEARVESTVAYFICHVAICAGTCVRNDAATGARQS